MNQPEHDHLEPTTNADHTDGESSNQAIQINDNTIADPGHPDTGKSERLHGRTDFPMNKDQGLQINDNSVGDKKEP